MAALYRSPASEEEVRRWCADRLGAWPVEHSTATIPTALGPTHLTSLGESADVCVYLPGTNFNAAVSTGFLEALAQRCRVVCADLPGQPGLSTADRSRTSVTSRSLWIGQVLAEARRGHSAGRLVLAGHSRGAALALSADPDAVDSLIMISPAGLASAQLTVRTVIRSVAWLLRPSDRSSARLVALMTGEDAGADVEETVEWMTLVARATRTSGAPGPLPPDTLRRWRGASIHIFVGEQDVFFPPERLAGPARRHLGQRLDVVPGAGHLLTGASTDQVADALTSALQ